MLERIKPILKKIAPEISLEEINEKTRLIDDLAFDSLSLMLLSLEIEEEFGFRFEESVSLRTVGEVCKYIEARETKK